MPKSIFESRTMIILVSIIWGFGIALLFRKACTGDNCTVYRAPPAFAAGNQIIYDRNNGCYQLIKYNSPCNY